MSKSHKALRARVEGAIFVAIAEILGYIKLWHMPDGGSVSLMMLPIVIFALRWGVGKGLLAGLALGILDFMLGGGIAIGWQSILGDYVVAITALGLAGVGHKKGLPGVIIGSFVGCACRWISIWATGALLWGVYMPDTFMGLTMTNEWFYSFLYSLPVIISVVITVILCGMLYSIKPLRKYISGGDII
jgi:thiamine transporter